MVALLDRLAFTGMLLVSIFGEHSSRIPSALLAIAFAILFVGDAILETNKKNCTCSHDQIIQ